jgi:hypothetical protein
MYMDWRTKKQMARLTSFMPSRIGMMGRGAAPRLGIDKYQYGDGLLSFVAKIGKAIVKPIANLVPKNTILSKALVAVGMATPKQAALTTAVGVGLGAAGAALTSGGAPGLPSGIPGLPAPQGGGGGLPFWKGPGGALQMPWSDPQQLFQAPYAYDDSYLKVTYRAPRGYVVVRDSQGRPYAMAKSIARAVGMYHPARKPPISAGDWHKYQTAATVEKKLRHIAGKAVRRHSRPVHVSKHK